MDDDVQETKERLLGRNAPLTRSVREYTVEHIFTVELTSDASVYLPNRVDLLFRSWPSAADIEASMFHYLMHVRKLHTRTKVFSKSVEKIHESLYAFNMHIVNKELGNVDTIVVKARLGNQFINVN